MARGLVSAAAIVGATVGATLGLSAAPAEARDNGVRCAILQTDGSWEFFLPGDVFWQLKTRWTCGNDGEWKLYREPNRLRGDGSGRPVRGARW